MDLHYANYNNTNIVRSEQIHQPLKSNLEPGHTMVNGDAQQ